MNTDAVKDAQHALRTLSFSNPGIPPISVDGIYGRQTEQAIHVFQQLNGLAPTGELDHTTWETLHDQYHATRKKPPLMLMGFPDTDFLLRPGDEHELSLLIAWILYVLSTQYDNVQTISPSIQYQDDAVYEIRQLQLLHGLNDDGIVDIHTWNMLASLLNNRNDVLKR